MFSRKIRKFTELLHPCIQGVGCDLSTAWGFPGPSSIACNAEDFLDVIHFFLSVFFCCDDSFCSMSESSNDPHFVFHGLVAGELEVLVCMCGLPVNLKFQAFRPLSGWSECPAWEETCPPPIH